MNANLQAILNHLKLFSDSIDQIKAKGTTIHSINCYYFLYSVYSVLEKKILPLIEVDTSMNNHVVFFSLKYFVRNLYSL